MGNQAVEIGKRNLNVKDTHWELLDLDNQKFEKPTVVCLSGDGTITNKDINGFAKMAETYLDLEFKTKDGGNVLDNVDIVGIKYKPWGEAGHGRLTEQAINQLSNAILSLLVDKNGKRLAIETAKKNMSRLTFFTYCYGHGVLQIGIIGGLNNKLSQVGYDENEIRAICNATLEVSYAPAGLATEIPSIRINSLKDNHFARIDDVTILDDLYDKSFGVKIHQDNPGSIYGAKNDFVKAKSIQVISSGLLNTIPVELDVDEHGVQAIARDKDWNLQQVIDKKTSIAYDRSPNANCVSEMMAWALCKGVENSVQNFKSDKYIPNTYWNEMMGDLQSIIDSYNHKELSSKPQDLGIER